MPRRSFTLPVLALVALGVTAQRVWSQERSLEQTAVSWMTLMMEGKFDSAAAEMSAESSIPPDQLAAFWPQLSNRYGKLKKLGVINRISMNGVEAVQLLGYFETEGEVTTHTVRVTFDAGGRPAGFFILDG